MPTVADHLAAVLATHGVRHAWGMPGGDTLPMVDAFADAGIDFVLVRDEASAGFAADASAQLTGALGCCVATLGPGLTNLVSGVAGCLLDRAPVLALTSRYKTATHAGYTHMMLDQTRLMEASAKAAFRMSAAGAALEARRAVALARQPRPGPVWLEIPTEVGPAPGPGAPLPTPPPPSPVDVPEAVAARVRGWRRPAILVGYGGHRAPVGPLAEALRAPVLTTYKAKGAVPEDDAGWWVGSASLSPVIDRVHQAHLAGCDGVVLVGWDPVELRDHWMPGWPDTVEVVVLDSHASADLAGRQDAVVAGPVDGLVASLAATLGEGASDWSADQVAGWRAAWQDVLDDGPHGPATAVRAVQAAVDAHAGDSVVTLDTGAHRITAANAWRARRPDRLLQSNGFASMGYALPAALAAAALGHPAVALTGDMGLQMVMGELMVAAEREWPLTVVVFIDDELALIGLKQKRATLPPRGVTFANPRLDALARAFGGTGLIARGPDEVRRAVSEGLARDGLTLVGVPIDAEAYLRQM